MHILHDTAVGANKTRQTDSNDPHMQQSRYNSPESFHEPR